jgi:hypothetical protein
MTHALSWMTILDWIPWASIIQEHVREEKKKRMRGAARRVAARSAMNVGW